MKRVSEPEKMSTEELLALSTGWTDSEQGIFGYLPFRAANELVARGGFAFVSISVWGYIVERRP